VKHARRPEMPGTQPNTGARRRPNGWWRTPDARVGALTIALTLTAVAVQMAWLAGGVPPIGQNVTRLVVLAVLFALAEKFVVTFPVRRGSHTLSLSEIPLVLGLVMIHPVLLVAVRVVGGAVGLIAFRQQRGHKLAFNLALYATQVTVAGAVFHLMAPSPDPLGVIGWGAAYAATSVTDVVSIILITAVIAVHDDAEEWQRLLTADIKSLFQLPMVAVSTTLGLVTALVVQDHVPATVLLAVLSFAVYRVLRRYAQQTQGHAQVEALYAFTRELGAIKEADEVVEVLLSRVRDLVRGESAELVLLSADHLPIRIRLTGQGRFETHAGDEPSSDQWWQAAGQGRPLLVSASAHRPPDSTEPADAMAVPVPLDDATGVLIVAGSMPDIPCFTADHLRLMQALAAHAAVALTNVRLVDRLRRIGLHDSLTGLPNRVQFLAELHRAVDDGGTAPHTVGVLLLDLDRFKEVNDALGHDVGDTLLIEMGHRLQEEFGARGTVARLGGDEFAIAVSHASSTDEILAIAGDVRQTVERPVTVGKLTLTAQASIGVCFAPDHGRNADRLLQRADVAMYAAKQARTGIRVYQREDDQNTPRRLALMTQLRVAIEQRAIDVVYQPKVDPVSGRVLGAEALARWSHVDGPVPPDEFIPLAERSGLIRPLTRHVLDTALAACSAWRRTGHHISVAVNLSPHIVADQTLTDEVRQALEAHDLPASALILEITENGIMDHPTHSRRTLASLHALGVNLSIDDFGTGHSSLGRLAELPIQEMKIDKSFVRHLSTEPSRRAVTDASLQLGRALNLTVVAEGVEDRTEFEYLRNHGCDAIQGYYISRPLPAAEFQTWLMERAEPSLDEVERMLKTNM
jgi:diguanylate cyclase (GGDEF)-like protein